MTKIAILGGSGYTAAELIKILLRHPHAEIVAVTSTQEGTPRGHRPASEPARPDRPAVRTVRRRPARGPRRHGRVRLLAARRQHDDVAGPAATAACASSTSVPTTGCAIRTSTPSGTARAMRTWPTWRRRSTGCRRYTATRSRPLSWSPIRAAIRKRPSSAWRRWSPASTSNRPASSSTARAACSGAGRTPKLPSHFPECNESVSAYSGRQPSAHAGDRAGAGDVAGEPVEVIFTPHLIPMDRGIFTTIYAVRTAAVHGGAVAGAVPRVLRRQPFVRVVDSSAGDQGHCPRTNFLDVTVRVVRGRVVVLACEDNLVRGASGVAVQNFNRMMGYDEVCGLL